MVEIKSQPAEAEKHEQLFQQLRSFIEAHLQQHGGDVCLPSLLELLVKRRHAVHTVIDSSPGT